MNDFVSHPRARELARLASMMSLAAALAACSNSESAASPPPPAPPALAPKATLSTPSDGQFAWHVAQPALVTLTDTRGVAVASSATTCVAHDATQATVRADCGEITALRVGGLVIDVSGGGVTASLLVQGVPQRQWTGVHGASRYAALTVGADGNGAAWGDNANGVLSQGVGPSTLASLAVATPMLGIAGLPYAGVAQTTLAEQSAAVLLTDGSAQAWGEDNFHELGATVTTNSTFTPVAVVDLTARASLQHVVQLEIGKENGVALIDDGKVVSWGGWPGNGTASSSSLPVETLAPSGAAPLSHVAAVSAGWNYSLALTEDGHVLSWGFEPGNGVLGTGSVINGVAQLPASVVRSDGTALDNIVQISAGYDFALALAADGTVWAWGDNAFGQLGRAAIGGSSAVAVQVQGLAGGSLGRIAMVAAGGNHALALDLDGRVLAWGYAPDGSLGDGATKPVVNQTSVPRTVVNEAGSSSGFTDIVSVAAGYANSYALGRDGRVLSWGSNFHGALGRMTSASSDNTPGLVTSAGGKMSLTPAGYPNLLRHAR